MLPKAYNQRPLFYRRRKTRTVWVGGIAVGCGYPIRIQSMTTSDTKDTQKVVDEIQGLVDMGCEIVRVTVPTQADCDNLPNIRAELKKRGMKVPLVADIHFTPTVAMKAAEYVEKVRINPGNFVDKKLFKVLEYTDAQYNAEVERIREKFTPLVLKCKEYGIAMRIGTNHGSLSDRIMNRYGDTPQGMVESALEFVRICRDHNYHNLILSMKASHVQVMMAAYRLLDKKMEEEGMNYPFHLGVTEAGEGEEGRVKSSIGIGTLLRDGLGDTIRVSLTEDSIHEIPVAYELMREPNSHVILSVSEESHLYQRDPSARPFGALPQDDKIQFKSSDLILNYERRTTKEISSSYSHGGVNPVRVWASYEADHFEKFKTEYQIYLGDRKGIDRPLEGLEIKASEASEISPWLDYLNGVHQKGGFRVRPLVAVQTSNPSLAHELKGIDKIVAVVCNANNVNQWKDFLSNNTPWLEWNLDLNHAENESLNQIVEAIKNLYPHHESPACFSLQSPEVIYDYRCLTRLLDEKKWDSLIQLRCMIKKGESVILSAATLLGSLLTDGLGDGFVLSEGSLAERLSLAYNILQGARLRMSQTEYISCPSCGRTLFDLQTTTDRIRQKTDHLKGVKIAVMGCIVNGPGEMADADFGYVGTGIKKISLYVGKECVERNIPEEEAVDRLIGLIKSHHQWIDPVEIIPVTGL